MSNDSNFYKKRYQEDLSYLQGFFTKSMDDEEYKKEIQDLKNAYVFNVGKQKEHLRYLKELFDYQETRQSTIENKLSQLMGQTGIIFSLTSLFIPLFHKEFSSYELYTRLLLLIPFIISLTMFLVSIYYSTKSLDISKDRYSAGSPKTVTNYYLNTEEFIKVEINDLFTSIVTNTHLNNNKADKLINAQKYFRRGIIILGLLLIIVSIFMFSPNQTNQ